MPVELLVPQGDIVRRLREGLGLSRDSLAEEFSKEDEPVSAKTIQRAEEGQAISRPKLEALAKRYGVPLANLLDHESLRYTLAHCQTDYRELNRVATGKQQFRSIALDLAYGFEHLMVAVNETSAREIEFQILVLGPTDRMPTDAPPVALKWAKTAVHSVECIREQSATFDMAKVSIEIRQYCEIPALHGVAISTDSRLRYYLTECVEDEDERLPLLTFGEGDYAIFDSGTQKQAERERADQFEAKFNRLWAAKQQPVFKYPMKGTAVAGSPNQPHQ